MPCGLRTCRGDRGLGAPEGWNSTSSYSKGIPALTHGTLTLAYGAGAPLQLGELVGWLLNRATVPRHCHARVRPDRHLRGAPVDWGSACSGRAPFCDIRGVIERVTVRGTGGERRRDTSTWTPEHDPAADARVGTRLPQRPRPGHPR